MPPKSVSVIGLDIGSDSVKCVEAQREEGQFRLNQLAMASLTSRSKEAVTEALGQIFSKKQFLSKKLRVSVSGPSLLVRRIQLPKLTYAELKGAIRFEAESHIPFPVDDCFLDFQILDPLPDKKLMNVLLVAAKKELVQERLRQVASLGMEPELVDVDVLCLVNAFDLLNAESVERVYGLLNVGGQGSSFAVVQDKQPFYVREIASGGQAITKALAEAKAVSEAEAEKTKLAAAPENAADLLSATQKGLEPLAEELHDSVDYFENESGESLKWIGLSGGGARLPAVAGVLSEELGRSVVPWDNSKKIQVAAGVDKEFFNRHACEFTIALGLALRELKGAADR